MTTFLQPLILPKINRKGTRRLALKQENGNEVCYFRVANISIASTAEAKHNRVPSSLRVVDMAVRIVKNPSLAFQAFLYPAFLGILQSNFAKF